MQRGLLCFFYLRHRQYQNEFEHMFRCVNGFRLIGERGYYRLRLTDAGGVSVKAITFRNPVVRWNLAGTVNCLRRSDLMEVDDKTRIQSW
jgi:hypothetical protein